MADKNGEKTISGDEMNSIALEIIMRAGDARLAVSDALALMAEAKFDAVDAKLDEAKKHLAEAHRLQTSIVQSEGEGVKHEHTLLFMHAQDTLMTIYSEMTMTRKLKAVFASQEKRIAVLEEKER